MACSHTITLDAAQKAAVRSATRPKKNGLLALLPKPVRGFLRGFWTLMLELSDENAYRRHLALRGVVHSPEEWRVFSDRKNRERYAQVKCC